uniref:Uncharacterized protein n=1 Tax=Nelumbo nucifera TaxID=4432 RepID=A0A822Y888_NELNU|nr:TPA_asm: hypothetical protein HUJ06_029950 [Nelumbo nucifera]
MRLSYSPAARLFLFLVQWTDCHLAGSLGLLRILIYKVHFFPLLGAHVLILVLISLHVWFYFPSLTYELCGLLSQAYEDGKTTMSVHERKASIREFYGKWTFDANV